MSHRMQRYTGPGPRSRDAAGIGAICLDCGLTQTPGGAWIVRHGDYCGVLVDSRRAGVRWAEIERACPATDLVVPNKTCESCGTMDVSVEESWIYTVVPRAAVPALDSPIGVVEDGRWTSPWGYFNPPRVIIVSRGSDIHPFASLKVRAVLCRNPACDGTKAQEAFAKAKLA